MTNTPSQLLIIAGLECNGFAGALKDIEVATVLNQTPSVVLTTLTAQSASSMSANQPTPVSVIAAQLNSLQTPPAVVKIGVLPNSAIATGIAQWLAQFGTNKPTVVLDPIQLSSSDNEPFSAQPLKEVIAPLVPFIDVITPNLNEFRALTDTPMAQWNSQEAINSFKRCFPNYNGHIIVKSALHDPTKSTITDVLLSTQQPNNVHHFTQDIVASSLRGTGCTYSTAQACALCQYYPLESATALASAFLAQARKVQGTVKPLDLKPTQDAWPSNINCFPTVAGCTLPKFSQGFPKLHTHCGLYPIVDSAQWVEKLAGWGVTTIQLRLKNKGLTTIEAEVKKAVAIAQQYNLQLFINDYWSLAIQYGAYGVHLGQEDLESADLPKIHRSGLRLGISTHGDYEFLKAKQLKPSYCAVGAIFPTQTKDMSGKIQGLERLHRYCKMAEDIPVVAIGGINLTNIDSVLAMQPNFIALVSAITQAEHPKNVTEQLLRAVPS